MQPNTSELHAPGTGNVYSPLAITPLLIGSALCDYLRKNLSSPESIEFEELKNYTWTDGPDTNILIEMWTHFKPGTAMHRPAILIQRLEMSNMRLLFGGERYQFVSQTEPLYSTFWESKHAIHCIGTTGAEAELLTSEVYRLLHQGAPILRSQLCLLRFMVERVSEVKIVNEWKQNFVSTITTVSFFEDSWSIQELPIYLNQLVIKTKDKE